MNPNTMLGRRAALRRALGIGAASLMPASLLTACGSKLACNDITDLSTPDLKTRTDASYVDASQDPLKRCAECKLYKPAGEKQCGGCTLIKGPINPNGNCKNWAAKT